MFGPPKDWLGKFDPGNGLPTGGLSYVQGKLIPFVISFLLFLVIIASLIFTVIGGIKWITSAGEKEGLTSAKATITWALLGLTFGIGSFLLMGILGKLLGVNLLGN